TQGEIGLTVPIHVAERRDLLSDQTIHLVAEDSHSRQLGRNLIERISPAQLGASEHRVCRSRAFDPVASREKRADEEIRHTISADVPESRDGHPCTIPGSGIVKAYDARVLQTFLKRKVHLERKALTSEDEVSAARNRRRQERAAVPGKTKEDVVESIPVHVANPLSGITA